MFCARCTSTSPGERCRPVASRTDVAGSSSRWISPRRLSIDAGATSGGYEAPSDAGGAQLVLLAEFTPAVGTEDAHVMLKPREMPHQRTDIAQAGDIGRGHLRGLGHEARTRRRQEDDRPSGVVE